MEIFSPSEKSMPSKTNGRSPKCTRCRNHGVINDLRGHKHKCIWRDCTCTKCLISSDRQRATADRIALFRQQMKEAQCTYDIDRKQCGGKIEKRVFNKEILPTLLSPDDIHLKTTSQRTPTTRESEVSLLSIPTVKDKSSSKSIYPKNIEILNYIFPFYSKDVLEMISHGCHDDVLQTVLSISQSILESQNNNTMKYRYDIRPTEYIPLSKAAKCCSSLYCPFNSYMALCAKASHLDTPCYPASPFGSDSNMRKQIVPSLKRRNSSDGEGCYSPTKRFSGEKLFSPKNSPYCQSCKKLGTEGDIFCALCGVSY